MPKHRAMIADFVIFDRYTCRSGLRHLSLPVLTALLSVLLFGASKLWRGYFSPDGRQAIDPAPVRVDGSWVASTETAAVGRWSRWRARLWPLLWAPPCPLLWAPPCPLLWAPPCPPLLWAPPCAPLLWAPPCAPLLWAPPCPLLCGFGGPGRRLRLPALAGRRGFFFGLGHLDAADNPFGFLRSAAAVHRHLSVTCREGFVDVGDVIAVDKRRRQEGQGGGEAGVFADKPVVLGDDPLARVALCGDYVSVHVGFAFGSGTRHQSGLVVMFS
jgi:hypothetical protein